MKHLRIDFPIFSKYPNLIYFDTAATSQKPRTVIDTITEFYQSLYAPVHRGMYRLAERATEKYEHARKVVAEFINADAAELIFTKNATEGINFIAATWATQHLTMDDEVLLTELEHHANLIPWQRLAKKNGIKLRFIPVTENGDLRYDLLPSLVTKKTKLISITYESNAIGTLVDIQQIISSAKNVGARILIDAAQAAGHRAIDVKKIKCDFLVFSAHKMLGPTGIGALYINKNIQGEVPPYQFGGGMIYESWYERSVFRPAPQLYEAGTQPVAQAIGFAAAVEYLGKVDFQASTEYEAMLMRRLINGLQKIKEIRLFGPIDQLKETGHLISFNHSKYHAHDVAAYFDKHNICVRSGHYCAQPLAKKLGIDSSVRVSFYFYNTMQEVDYLLDLISQLK